VAYGIAQLLCHKHFEWQICDRSSIRSRQYCFSSFLAFGAGNAKVVQQCGCVQERAAIFQRLHEKPSALISETREKSPAREREREERESLQQKQFSRTRI